MLRSQRERIDCAGCRRTAHRGQTKSIGSELHESGECLIQLSLDAGVENMQPDFEERSPLQALLWTRARPLDWMGWRGKPGRPRRASIPSAARDISAPSKVINGAIPVTFPPGRLRLATRPSATGSLVDENTTGIVEVAALAASEQAVRPPQKRPPRGWRRDRPPGLAIGRSAHLPSGIRLATFCPSLKPASPSPRRNAAMTCSELLLATGC